MKILTKAILKKLPKLYTHDGKKPADIPIIFKLFVPWSGYTLYVTEGEEQRDGDFTLYGYVTGMQVDELGYASLNELLALRGPGGLGIERDLHFGIGEYTLADVDVTTEK